MISKEQIERCLKEFVDAAAQAFSKARDAEKRLETYTYQPSRNYNPTLREKLLAAYRDADYEAESRAYILALLKQGEKSPSIPHTAICFFLDGDQWCCVHHDFINLQESPAGVGKTLGDARASLATFHPHMHVNNGIKGDDSCKRCGRDLRHEIHLRADQ